MIKTTLLLFSISTFTIAGNESICRSNLELCAKQDIEVARAYLANDPTKMIQEAKHARVMYRKSFGSCLNTKLEKTWEANSERLNELIELKDYSDDRKVRDLLKTRK